MSDSATRVINLGMQMHEIEQDIDKISINNKASLKRMIMKQTLQ